MAPRSGSGVLITLEGGEGSGKTTQCVMLVEWLRAQGLRVTTTREPGGTPSAERLRALLLDPELEPLQPAAEALLFAACRAQAVARVMRPALEAGHVVVSDRFVDSSLAYQGYGLGVDRGFLIAVNQGVTGGLRPDLTLLFDLPPELGRRRKGRASADRIEARGSTYHRTVRLGYLALAAEEPERIRVVDAAGDPATVHDRVCALVGEVLSRRGLVPTRQGDAPRG